MRSHLFTLVSIVGSILASSGRASPQLPQAPAAPLALELVGQPAAGFPHFRFVRVVQVGRPVWVAVDPTRSPELVGLAGELYVVAARTESEWRFDATLVDARGAPQPFTLQPGSIQDNQVLVDGGTLPDLAGTELGVGYDVVIDYDLDGRLGERDVIDGLGDETGFWVLSDLTQPGPYVVTSENYSGGSFLGQRTYYPVNIAALERLPLVVISHGNGHNYTWYDHIGEHLASWGCVVMSHQNKTAPGPQSASLTTLRNTDYLLGHQDLIAGGVLAGHIDGHRISWIGHSRGGEGVVRAYNMLVQGEYTADLFGPDDIRLVSSIAPTQFLVSSKIDPFAVNYHMFVGAADTDVNGKPTSPVAQSLPIFERAEGEKLCTILQGAGHADFHDQDTQCFCGGPDKIGKAGTHPVEKAYYLALVKRFSEGSEPARDVLERAFDDLALAGIPPEVIAANEYHVAAAAPRVVVEDYQSAPDLFVSSSGGAVSHDVFALTEGLMVDLDGSFEYFPSAPFNGMTRWRDAGDDPHCAVFEWDGGLPLEYEFELPAGARDLRRLEWLSFRACQGTRHPLTDAHDGPLSFSVELIDEDGVASSIDFAPYGRLTRPYKRKGNVGAGEGWANEPVTVRIRVAEFTHDTPALDLERADRLRLRFGPRLGTPIGRIGIDDIEFLPKVP